MCGGPLAFLPIHAAGLYGPVAVDGSKLSDFIVSSYTPTLTSLCNGANPRTLQGNKLLTVALPKKSKPALPGTQVELDVIHKQIGDFTVLQPLESKATVDSVIDGMRGCSWVHFACHGI
jgi:CHAT domain-containing protein